MTFVGNDIVDLSSPYAIGKSRDKRFVERVLTTPEIDTVLRSGTPDKTLWGIWAAKEAAYKAVSKCFSDASSAPRRYPVYLRPDSSDKLQAGIVETPYGRCCFSTQFAETFCHCICVKGETFEETDIVCESHRTDDKLSAGYNTSGDYESSLVRQKLKQRMASHFRLKEHKIDIIRSEIKNGNEPPMAYYNGKKANVDISLSHDGRYVAFAFNGKYHPVTPNWQDKGNR